MLSADKAHYLDLISQQEQDLADVQNNVADLRESHELHQRDLQDLQQQLSLKQQEIQEVKQSEFDWQSRVEDAKRDHLTHQTQLSSLEKELISLKLRLKAAEDRKRQQFGIVEQRQKKGEELRLARQEVYKVI